MRSLLAITKALSDANRVRIVCALERGELCVCQIQELLGLAHSTTSKHLSLLAAAGLLDVRKEGRWAYYRLADEEARAGLREVVGWLCRQAAQEKHVAEDRRRLDAILRIPPEELCQLQANGSKSCSSAPATRAGARSRRASRTRSKAT
ncbi:MAG: helix-turn-helix transcriptional regulator [Candidatus Sumerlaeia bacterium]|nr:helix-turn-helix transcriptional regulator [Candidatus Sumerlaeia bacterium]